MSARWIAAAALAMLATSANAQSVSHARYLLTHCAEQVPTAHGLHALRSACPGVGRALTRTGLAQRLPRGWRARLAAADLRGLATLAQRYHRPLPRRINAAALQTIARALKPARAPPDAWSRLVHWIHRHTEPLVRWLRQHLRALTGNTQHVTLGHLLLYALAAALVLALLVWALLHRRTAGRPRRSSAQEHAAPGAFTTPRVSASEPSADGSSVPPHPAQWLRVLVSALTSSRRLERERGLTCRELTQRAHFDSDTQRADFQRIVELAERELYGSAGTDPIPEPMQARMRSLHAELRRPPAPTRQIGGP